MGAVIVCTRWGGERAHGHARSRGLGTCVGRVLGNRGAGWYNDMVARFCPDKDSGGLAPMEPVAHKSIGFAAARAWEIEQEVRLTPGERLAIAEELKRRAYGTDAPDVRQVEREK